MTDEEETLSDEKPRSDKITPNTTPTEFSARLQVLTLPGDDFALVFDQWEGPPLAPEQAKRIKDETGAKAVLFFRGIIDIGC